MLLLNQKSVALIIICDGPELKDGLLIADGTSGLENRRLGGGLAGEERWGDGDWEGEASHSGPGPAITASLIPQHR